MREISKEDILARLRFDNPWWEAGTGGAVPYESNPRRRYFPEFQSAVVDTTVRRALVLMGPRRVGKTVMVYQSVRALLDAGVEATRILYLSLETPVFTGLPLEKLLNYFRDIHGHGRVTPLYLYFDEIQYLREWEVHLKSLVDSYPDYRFVATGSAAAALKMKSHESGAGRFSDFVLPPLTFAEYLSFIGREEELVETRSSRDQLGGSEYVCRDIEALNQEFVSYLNFGGYPEAVFSESIRSNPAQYIKSDIIDKVLLRDLPSLYGISDIQELNRLFTTLAYNTANEVSLEELSKSAGVAKNTIRRYIEYLEAAFLIRRVERIDHSAKRFKRAVRFKVYLTNPSMRAALFGQIEAESEAMGSLAETAIFSQWQHHAMAQLYYARWNSGEVDIVRLSPRNQKPEWAVEIKWSDRAATKRSELDNCVYFAKQHPGLNQPVLFTTRTISENEVEYHGVRFSLRPSSLYAYTLGANLLKNLRLIRKTSQGQAAEINDEQSESVSPRVD